MSSDDLACSITSYDGFEEDILDIRNRNRDFPQTRAYLDWRYLGCQSAIPPVIFWVQKSNGIRIGMASIIYRQYWIVDEVVNVAVLGDISIDKKYRRSGLGRKLLRFVTDYIRKERILSFVLPNNAVAEILSSIGWQGVGKRIRYVFFLNITEKLHKIIKIKALSCLCNAIYRLFWIANFFIEIHGKEIDIQLVEQFDDSFVWFNHEFYGENILICNKNKSYLTWRYIQKPDCPYNILQFTERGMVKGYLIYTLSELPNICVVVDLFAETKESLVQLIKLFLYQRFTTESLNDTVYITLSKDHPYSNIVSGMGFVKRDDKDFILSSPIEQYSKMKVSWVLTTGDKDV